MKPTTHTSTAGAVQIHAKLVASAATVVVGYVAGSIGSIADSAKLEAESNPEGFIAKGLNRTIREHWAASKSVGYEHVQEAKEVFSFDEEHIQTKPKTT